MSENKKIIKRRGAIQIMKSLIGLVKPLIHIMLAAILLGTLGYLCAIFLTILAGQVIVRGLLADKSDILIKNMWLAAAPVKNILTVMSFWKFFMRIQSLQLQLPHLHLL